MLKNKAILIFKPVFSVVIGVHSRVSPRSGKWDLTSEKMGIF
jgi:hypothetical protein